MPKITSIKNVGDRKSDVGLNSVGCSKNSDQLEVSGLSEYDSIMPRNVHFVVIFHSVSTVVFHRII